MPLKLKTRCRHPGCPRLTRTGFCDEHAGTYSRQSDERRGSSKDRGYDATWARLADLRRSRDGYLCQLCLRVDRLTSSKIVDHIVPLHVRPDWRLVLENTQVICPVCHQQKSADDTRRYGSSTATTLTDVQRSNREEAARLVTFPRDD